MIQDKGIKGVHLPGFVSESERQRYTQQAKWMVTPPRTHEDLGLTPLEARSVWCAPLLLPMVESRKRQAHMLSFCKPGDIDSLYDCLKKAIQMEENQYQELSQLAKVDLEQYVRPLG